MLIVPLQPVPNQAVSITLANQLCQINVYQKGANLYLDLLVNNVPIIVGTICENLNRLVRSLYLGFSGDLAFIDNQGSSDPIYTGLGPTTDARYSLAYIEAGDLLANEG
jgi:hypothetical protein